MNYSANYLLGANMLDSEMEQFDRNPAEYVESMGWAKEKQEKSNSLKGRLELVKNDYLMLEKAIDLSNGDIEDNFIQAYITLLFAEKISRAIK